MYPGWEIKTGAFHMTDKEFEKFCAENRDMHIERDAKGNIWLMSPTYSKTGEYNSGILIELGIWNKKTLAGYVFDLLTGFILPNTAMRSPDVTGICQSVPGIYCRTQIRNGSFSAQGKNE